MKGLLFARTAFDTLIKPQWETIQVHTYAASYQAQKLYFCTKDGPVICTEDYGNVCVNYVRVTDKQEFCSLQLLISDKACGQMPANS